VLIVCFSPHKSPSFRSTCAQCQAGFLGNYRCVRAAQASDHSSAATRSFVSGVNSKGKQEKSFRRGPGFACQLPEPR